MELVVTLPLMAAVPDPPPEAATEPMALVSEASTSTLAGAISWMFFSVARTPKLSAPSPMRLLADAPPMAATALPATVPANESILPEPLASTFRLLAVPRRLLPPPS